MDGERKTACPPDMRQLREFLLKARRIAVIGAKDKPGQPVDGVGRYLMKAGYELVPVHPKRSKVWGLETYESITDIPFPVDIVDVFRAPQHCLGHAREALRLKPLPLLFWMQLGIAEAGAANLLAAHGVAVVENACLMIEHQRLFPFPA